MGAGGPAYLIVAHGAFVSSAIMERLAKDRMIIALDGAAGSLKKRGMIPHVILGDFDSLTEAECQYWGIEAGFDDIHDASAPYVGRHGVQIVPAKDQSKTDLSKAIEYADLWGASAIDMVCATDGRMDHTLSNLRVLRAMHRETRPLRLHTATETIVFVRNATYAFSGKSGDYCAAFGFPEAVITSKGTAYDVSGCAITFSESDSTCNRLADTTVTYEVSGDALIIAPLQR